MSGTSRFPSAGVSAVWNAGLVSRALAATPPPVEEPKPSFQVVSPMYPLAEPFVMGSLVESQNMDLLVASAENRVPPTAVTSGMAPGTSTARPVVATVAVGVDGSQSVAPESPMDELILCPLAWACVMRSCKPLINGSPFAASQAP